MTVQLLSCNAARPDRRAIAKTLVEISDSIDPGLAQELTDILLEGTPIEVEITQGTSSAFRALRKLDIEYELDS